MTIEEHYNAIAPKLTSYLVGVGTDYHAACDIVQETFLRLWKKRDELMDDPAQVSGYVYTIARHLRADRLRRQSRETLQEEITDEDAGAVMPSDTSATDAAYLRRRLNDALAQLPPLVREAFSLFQISECDGEPREGPRAPREGETSRTSRGCRVGARNSISFFPLRAGERWGII